MCFFSYFINYEKQRGKLEINETCRRIEKKTMNKVLSRYLILFAIKKCSNEEKITAQDVPTFLLLMLQDSFKFLLYFQLFFGCSMTQTSSRFSQNFVNIFLMNSQHQHLN